MLLSVGEALQGDASGDGRRQMGGGEDETESGVESFSPLFPLRSSSTSS